jgi:sugar phosphate isomerase/epimerase
MTAPGPLSLNTITVKALTLSQAVEACARHRIPGISPWRDVLQAMGTQAAAQHIRDAGLKVTGLCRGGMFTVGDRVAAIDDNRRAIAEAHAIGADCLVMVCGGLPQGSKDLPGAREIVREGLHAILPEARAAGVTIAIEPLHPMTCADRSVLSTLGQALDLCDELGAGTGVAVDVYHVWWDPDLARQMARAKGRIAGFHVCDWKVPTTDLVFDRGLPGEGVIDIPAIRAMAEAAGWTGGVEVEILSNRWWAQDPDAVLREVKARHAFC